MISIINVIKCLIVLSIYKVGSILAIYEDNSSNNNSNFNFTTKYGQTYDRLDSYKQIAFRNPIIKNYTSKEIKIQKEATQLNINRGLNHDELETVPILRTKKSEDNLKDSSAMKLKPQGDLAEQDHCMKLLHHAAILKVIENWSKVIEKQAKITAPKQNCLLYAVVRTNNPSSKFYGVSGSVSLYNPKVHDTQWSTSRIKLQNGPDSIEAGWMVNPTFFKDFKTRFYIRFVTGNKGCFNLECPGYVHVKTDMPLGVLADKVNSRGDTPHYYWLFSIVKNADGNWWLSGVDLNGTYNIGYWPNSLFTHLTDFATQVEWGGEVYYPQNTHYDPPQMGSGSKAKYDTKVSANYMFTKVVNDKHQSALPPRETIKVQNCKKLYTVLDEGYAGVEWGRIMYFGGPDEST